MTVEAGLLVYLDPPSWEGTAAQFARQAELSARKQRKALPGDRKEAERFDAACAHVEAIAQQHRLNGAPVVPIMPEQVRMLDAAGNAADPGVRYSWHLSLDTIPAEFRQVLAQFEAGLASGGALVELRDPLSPGSGVVRWDEGEAIPPAGRWTAPDGERGLRAVQIRFEEQLQAAAAGEGEPVVPSGVSNTVLTEGLRRYVGRKDGLPAVAARVVYRDGSEARPLRLGDLAVSDDEPEGWPVLRIALLSLRHPEMDLDVDAAWLRNRDISQVRPQAETDELVYRLSGGQFARLLTAGPRIIHLYQTGLEPAIVGFYRALTDHLTEHPGSLAVIPQYYHQGRPFVPGTLWASKT